MIGWYSGRIGRIGKGNRMQEHRRVRSSGGYRELRSFQTTTIIYDATVAFCTQFVDKRSRIVDQMVQAARSGRQNIAEGSRAAATSSLTELRLVNVARASLDELLLDYEDFLRQRGIPQWSSGSPEAIRVRDVGRRTDTGSAPSDGATNPYAEWLGSPDPGVVANALICLIHQANYLLDRQISALEQQFIREGGYSERLAGERLAERQRQSLAGRKPDRPDRTDRSDRTERRVDAPECPVCRGLMVLRTAQRPQCR